MSSPDRILLGMFALAILIGVFSGRSFKGASVLAQTKFFLSALALGSCTVALLWVTDVLHIDNSTKGLLRALMWVSGIACWSQVGFVLSQTYGSRGH